MSNLVDRNETEELLQRTSESNKLTVVSLIFIAFSIAFCLHSIYSIGSFLSDKSVPLVACPKSFTLDAPVLMKPIRDESALVHDRWLRGFTRRFVTSLFPRTGKDVRPFFQYIVDHSQGDIKEKYEALLKDGEEISNIVQYGSFYRFYPKHVDSSPAVRIRAIDDLKNPQKWSIEIDGYLIKRMGQVQERYNPTLKYTVEAGKPTLTNPEGLYIIDGTIEQITDYVSNTKEKL